MAGLDDLDLDDMFNDDGDNLFDGLDIELDGAMGDIINNEKTDIVEVANAATAIEPPPPPKPRRTGGPRTKRTNPMLEKEEMEAAAAGGGTKKTKTKRKRKVPSAFGDEADVDMQAALIEMHQPKKKRKAALKATKATEELAAANQPKSSTATATTTKVTKRKKKITAAGGASTASASSVTSKGTGIPSMTASSIGTGSTTENRRKLPMVAAAGRFGSGVQKRGSASFGAPGSSGGTIKIKRVKKKIAAGAFGADSGMLASGGTQSGIHVQPRIAAPKPEPTFGGITPGVLFYPFLDGIPSQAAMPRKKAYPTLDKIASALNSAVANASSSSSGKTGASSTSTAANGNAVMNGSANHLSVENSAVFKLMLETYGGLEDKDKTGTVEKRAALVAGMSKFRDTIGDLDRAKIVGDVFSVCWLLTRQYNLLKQSLENMQYWCKDTFSEEDYQATYEEEEEKAKQRLRKWSSATVKVKIALTGFREPKGATPLEAMLPSFVVAPPTAGSAPTKVSSTTSTGTATTAKTISSDSASVATPTKAKKRKPTTTTATSVAASRAKAELVVPYPPVASVVSKGPRTYADATPQIRRQLMMDRISQLAVDLEQVTKQNLFQTAPPPTIKSFESMLTDDPHLNTGRMWEWLQIAGFYKPLDQLSLRQLAVHRSPEENPRGHLLSSSARIQSSDEPKRVQRRDPIDGLPTTDSSKSNDEPNDTEVKVSSDSIFDRLQALLVEEDIPDEASNEATFTEVDNSGLKSFANHRKYQGDELELESDDDEESLGFLDDDDDDGVQEANVTGVSSTAVTSNEREQSVLDMSRLSLEERTFVHLSSTGLIRRPIFPSTQLAKISKKAATAVDEKSEDDLAGVVGNMATDLSKTVARNNDRLSFLQASTAGSNLISNRQTEEEQASVIAKCQNLLKRSKEKAKKAKQKKIESLNLPW